MEYSEKSAGNPFEKLLDTINRRLTASGYAVTANSFPFGARGSLSQFKSELLRASDLVIVCRATSRVQKCLAESGVNRFSHTATSQPRATPASGYAFR